MSRVVYQTDVVFILHVNILRSELYVYVFMCLEEGRYQYIGHVRC